MEYFHEEAERIKGNLLSKNLQVAVERFIQSAIKHFYAKSLSKKKHNKSPHHPKRQNHQSRIQTTTKIINWHQNVPQSKNNEDCCTPP